MHDDDWERQEQQWQRQFARNLRAARERAQLTQGDVAEALGMSETVYARYEAARTWPAIGRLRHLCQILDCSADVLLGYRALDEHALPPAPPRDAPRLRRLLRLVRQARPELVQTVHQMLDILDGYRSLPAPGSEPRGRS
jgi:transcriptional regulator with XRE-family HTH domain